MVLCRPGQENPNREKPATTSGGPVFVPPRKPSPLAEGLLAELREDVTPCDDRGFAGQPVR